MEKPCPTCAGTGKIRTSILRQLRERKGASQAQAAAALGMTQPGYSKLEKRGPDWGMRYGMWEKLEKYFGATRNQLTGRDPLPGPKAPRPVRAPDAASLARSKKNKAAIAAKNRRR